jgi:hypothetical protein
MRIIQTTLRGPLHRRVRAGNCQLILKLEGRRLRHVGILTRQFFIANGSQIRGKAERIDNCAL